MKDYSVDEDTSSLSDSITSVIVLGPICLLLSSFLVPVYQVCYWLKEGIWKPVKTDVLFSLIMPEEFYLWLNGASWLGAKAVVRYAICDMSLFLFMLIVSGIILYLVFK